MCVCVCVCVCVCACVCVRVGEGDLGTGRLGKVKEVVEKALAVVVGKKMELIKYEEDGLSKLAALFDELKQQVQRMLRVAELPEFGAKLMLGVDVIVEVKLSRDRPHCQHVRGMHQPIEAYLSHEFV